jgi:hypothetical protein
MASEFAHCHKCGAQLVRANHIKFGKLRDYAESDSGSFAVGADYGWLHNPCPQCGEPEPIRSKYMPLILGGFFLAFFGAIIFLIFYLQP